MREAWGTTALPFRTLYRVFLLRVVDLTLLSADADPAKLINQFVTIFATISFFFSLPALIGALGGGVIRGSGSWPFEHFFIETSMTLAALITVLNWDNALPDRQDVLILAPLPVSNSTLLMSKIAAFLASPGLAIVALNVFSGVLWPVSFRAGDGGILWLLRAWIAYWLTIFLGSAFSVFAVLTIKGLVSNILPRPLFLQVSALLQAGLLCLLLSVYFLGPSLESPEKLMAPENQISLACLPAYWFLGLFQQLNGSLHPALATWAYHAWIGLALVTIGTLASLLLTYFRMMARIVEQPNIAPGVRTRHWSPSFGSPLKTAITLFTFRTLSRSRQHRMVMSFYLGLGLTVVVGYIDLAHVSHLSGDAGISTAFLLVTLLMMILTLLALRVVATLPISLPANWIIRVTQERPAETYQDAVRFSWMAIGIFPVTLTVAASLLLSRDPWKQATEHLILMAGFGLLIVEVCAYSFPKIPFTCSYLPGKAKIHFLFWACLMLFVRLLYELARLEKKLLNHPLFCAAAVLLLLAGAIMVRWAAGMRMKARKELQFEEEFPNEIISLKIR